MKRASILISLVFASGIAICQTLPVEWEVRAEQHEQHYTLYVDGKIANGWHVYAQDDASTGIDALTISWDNENVIQDQIQNSATPDHHGYKDPLFGNKLLQVYVGQIHLQQNLAINGVVPSSITVHIKGFVSNDKEFLPIDDARQIQLQGIVPPTNELKLAGVDISKPMNDCGESHSNQQSGLSGGQGLLAIFLLGLAGGLFALLTPCVFPMIPVTVSYFTNYTTTGANDSKKNLVGALLYGAFILFIYLAASIPFHLLGNINPQIFNNISTNAWLNVFFFVVFILFALSFFGLFEIRLPSFLGNSAGNRTGITSVSGIFFMALTLAIVSFSCTGPILGSLLVGSLSSSGGAWQLTAGMGGFGVALALPFALFAMFPGWMKALPKSGSWLGVVKKVLAFVEVALAFKFLSNADLVEHWGLLKREVFVAIWIATSLGLALYLFGAFEKKRIVVSKLQNAALLQPKKLKLSAVRIVVGVVVFIFALYLIPGVTQTKYANLKLLSGFPPPLSYSLYGKNNVQGKGLEPAVINDYQKALQLAKQQHKPLLIDFTGWACVNCRKMEEQVWTKPEIQELINDRYILVSLYVDDRKKLSPGETFTYKAPDGDSREIKTIGDKWAAFQAENFSQVTQPLYVVLSPDEKLMNRPVGYTPNVAEYETWLKCGIDAYNKNIISEKRDPQKEKLIATNK